MGYENKTTPGRRKILKHQLTVKKRKLEDSDSDSDMEITELDTTLESEPGTRDEIMADRGFTIDDLLFPLRVKLNIPAFTKNKPQLSAEDVTTTRRIARKPASGDASLAGSQQSSGDASLDKASRDALLATATYRKGTFHQSPSAQQSSGDASLVKTSQLTQNPASGDASLAGSQQSSRDALLDKASRDA
ncbi:unnamed protein product [Mytilus coruscus]|uniref:DDE Tnp4 domain-containing protein n=1 Tax=Mytilus coruscus TaxID=42192 RepID=A0A6J8BV64_MYTCO|nr:unnamed protein product [Mytilus coruscus]